ncbi:MAG: hypothetical protein LH472_04865 [Pyrinomonadaceae bacterium]|nr:hypothetical protein [Pyrinomonadaceae bacterium]
MKNILMQKAFSFLGQRLLAFITQRLNGKPQVAGMEKHKKLSFEQKYLPKVSQFLKNRFRQTTRTKRWS